jgi:hypothetical protein
MTSLRVHTRPILMLALVDVYVSMPSLHSDLTLIMSMNKTITIHMRNCQLNVAVAASLMTAASMMIILYLVQMLLKLMLMLWSVS